MKTKLFKNFQEAISAMPGAVIGNFDPIGHTNTGDLAWIAQHELDMYQEGEETDITSEAEAFRVRAYRDKCLASQGVAEAAR
jgi:hypothetical protein